MIRLTCIILLSSLISGCPAMMYGNLKNSDKSELTVIPPHIPDNPWTISSGERVKVVWSQECIMIRDGSRAKYFAGWPIPENTVTSSIFSSSINALYSNGSLFFETKNGALVQAKEIGSCGNV